MFLYPPPPFLVRRLLKVPEGLGCRVRGLPKTLRETLLHRKWIPLSSICAGMITLLVLLLDYSQT